MPPLQRYVIYCQLCDDAFELELTKYAQNLVLNNRSYSYQLSSCSRHSGFFSCKTQSITPKQSILDDFEAAPDSTIN